MQQTTYALNDVKAAASAYFGGDELAADTWTEKYALRNLAGELVERTPDDTHRRLAREFARIEARYGGPNQLDADTIFELFRDFAHVIPQGSPLSVIGDTERFQTPANCYVVAPPEDSYGGILRADQELVQISKRRGGVGVDVSSLRPKGRPTANAARTTDGIGVFMQRFSNSIREVAQNGRRGALLISCHVAHPEIRTFITIKRDRKKVTGANISVRFTDEFMRAVRDDAQYVLRWPVEAAPEEAEVTETVRAREIWDLFVDAAHDSAEPGALFWDAILRGPADLYAPSVGTNPCQPGGATVLTPDGIRTFDDIDVGSTIWSGQRWTTVTAKAATGLKPVFRYHTRAGTFVGTEEHRVLQYGDRCEVRDAEAIDRCVGPEPELQPLDPQDIVNGLVLGDGSWHVGCRNVWLQIGANDQDYFTSEVAPLIGEKVAPSSDYNYYAESMFTSLPHPVEREVPAKYRRGSTAQMRGFLRGLYSANGSIVGRAGQQRVTLKASSFRVIEGVQEMLSALGIRAYYTTNKPTRVAFSNGEYECKQSYDLNITSDAATFERQIGFLQKYKQERLRAAVSAKTASYPRKTAFDIVDVEAPGVQPVYDITIAADEHTYWTGGLLVSNCSEIPLSAYDSCRLFLLNLMGYVRNPFTSAAWFDWELFRQHVTLAMRLMDDLVDLDVECVDRIIAKIDADGEPLEVKATERALWQKVKAATQALRRTGLGLTAVGDALAAIGHRYGSAASIGMAEELYSTFAIAAERANIALAKERGAFPLFDAERELRGNNGYLKLIAEHLTDAELTDWAAYGRRCASCSTSAPAGSMSIVAQLTATPRAFQVTSGIEPVAVALKTKRRRKVEPRSGVRVDFVDPTGDSWQEYDVYHAGLRVWLELNPGKTLEESPYWQATSADVDWRRSVDIQAAAQRWISHAISKTCNLPADATKDVVGSAYLAAWEAGCKGFTVYRDGSRTGVIVQQGAAASASGRPTALGTNHAPTRPVTLPCEVHHVAIRGERWTIIVGMMGLRPYEIFGGLSSLVELPRCCKTGTLTKRRKQGGNAVYDLELPLGDAAEADMLRVADIAAAFQNPVHGAFTRALSLSLRHGVPVQYVVEQLLRDKHSDMTSFSAVLARILKKYVADGVAASGGCQQCGAATLVYQEGCAKCTACGWSKC